MPPKSDILVLGATGFTGRLVTNQLNAHRDRASFTFALGARSPSKLAALVEELDLSAQIQLVTVDVTKPDAVESAVKNTRVVINTVGPYWRWGTPVVRACVRNGVHYVDLSGETAWIRDIISEFDYAATKSKAVIIPACGLDSIPADLSTYLSIRTLKEHLGLATQAGRSTTAYVFKGGISGGTLSTMYTYMAEIPRQKIRESFADHSLSPAAGAPSPRYKIMYSLPHVRPPIFGGFFMMSNINRAIVHRTRGLHEVNPCMKSVAYGPQFTYEEFLATRSRLAGIVLSLSIYFASLALAGSGLFRWLFKLLIVNRVYGPSAKEMDRGYLKATNVTSSVPTPTTPEIRAKTVIRIRGDPAYLCSAVMLAECASALLDTSKLTLLAQEGGVLTPVSAFGEELVKCLGNSGRFKFECSIMEH